MAVRECLPCMVLLKIIIKVQCSTNNSVFLYTKHMDTELQTPQLNVLFLKWSVSQPKWGQLFSRGAWAPSRPTGWTCARPSAPVCHSIPTPHGFLLPLTQYCFVSILLCVQLSRSLCFSWRLSRSYRWALLCCHNLAGWPRPSPQPLPHSPPEHRPQCLLWASLSSTVLGGAQTAVVSQMMMMGKMSKLHKSLTEH